MGQIVSLKNGGRRTPARQKWCDIGAGLALDDQFGHLTHIATDNIGQHWAVAKARAQRPFAREA